MEKNANYLQYILSFNNKIYMMRKFKLEEMWGYQQASVKISLSKWIIYDRILL